MWHIHVRYIALVTFFLLLNLNHFQHTKAVNYTEISFASDTSWDTQTSDPVAGTTIPVGKAQNVCLNEYSPVLCPDGATLYNFAGMAWSADLSSIPNATWIWAPSVISTTSPADLQEYYFSKIINLPEPIVEGSLSIAVDDFAEIRVNNSVVGTIGSTTVQSVAIEAQSALVTLDITGYLVKGDNLISIHVQNGPPEFANCTVSCLYAQNPAGVVFGGVFRVGTPTSLDESEEPKRIFLPNVAR